VGLVFSAVIVGALLIVGSLLTQAGSGLDLVARLATVTVLFLLFIYALVIISALRLRGQDEDEKTFRANTPLLYVGLVGNAAIFSWSVHDDPSSLLWCAALIGVGVVLFVIERVFGTRDRATS
jgi:L-asparagine transporter-like permease